MAPAAVAAALTDIRARIAADRREGTRALADVTLIAVSKTHGAAAIEAALAAGQRHFGENRVQEAAEKWPPLRAKTPDLQLHLIGPLQTNKVPEAVALFDVIHTLDRPRLAEKLAAEMTQQGRRQPCFVQIGSMISTLLLPSPKVLTTGLRFSMPNGNRNLSPTPTSSLCVYRKLNSPPGNPGGMQLSWKVITFGPSNLERSSANPWHI